jgi:prepilin-type N-terminal cleavage/methylation domain-containing protein
VADGFETCCENDTSPVPTGQRSDAGFTLIEILVVMIIIAILMAVSVPTFLGAKKTARRKEATATALAYKQAVSQFMLDHSNRVPSFGVATDWPTATPNGGPVSMLTGTATPYMHPLPETVSDRKVDVSAGTAPSAAAGLEAVTYVSSAPAGGGAVQTQYTLYAWARKDRSSPWDASTHVCATGNAPTPSGWSAC